MNKCILCGRLTADPEIRSTSSGMTVARYTLAIDRIKKDEADFVRCIAFDKAAEFTEKYLKKGMKILVESHVQTGSYEGKDGKKVYTTDFVIERQEFVERREETKGEEKKEERKKAEPQKEEFMSIPDNLDDSGLPWN